MASLTISQIQTIKEHMTHDESMLAKKFKAKKTPYDTQSILLNELEDYLSKGWEEVSRSKYKAKSKDSNQLEEGLKMIFGVCFITLVLDT